jgi:ABC-type sulfate transport system permease subunit
MNRRFTFGILAIVVAAVYLILFGMKEENGSTGSSETQNKVVFAIPCIVRVDRTINEKKEMLFIF